MIDELKKITAQKKETREEEENPLKDDKSRKHVDEEDDLYDRVHKYKKNMQDLEKEGQ